MAYTKMLWVVGSPAPVGLAYIDIVTLPNKLSYRSGQAIDITGLEVHFYDENGNDLGAIPNNQLSYTPRASMRSGMTASSSHGNAVVDTAGTVISTNNGSKTPFTKVNNGYGACILGFNCLGTEYGGDWFGAVCISDDEDRSKIRTPNELPSANQYTFNNRNLTYYFTSQGSNHDWGGSTEYTNPLNLPYTEDYQWTRPNYPITDTAIKYFLRYANILYVGGAVTITFTDQQGNEYRVQYGIEVEDSSHFNATVTTSIENYVHRVNATITTSIDNYDAKLPAATITTSIENYEALLDTVTIKTSIDNY